MSKHPSALILTALLTLLVTATTARAAEQPYVHEGLVYRTATAARYNPLGLSEFVRVGARHRLLGEQENILLQSTYIGLNAIGLVTPAFARGGLRFDIQPLAILNILIAYEGIAYFGTFDSMEGFSNVGADFSDAAQARKAKQGESYAALGRTLTITPTLQAKVWRITFVSWTDFVYNDMQTRAGATLYYDLPYGMLAARAGWLLNNETELTFEVTRELGLGLRHGYSRAFYPQAAVAGAEARAREAGTLQYLGGVANYEFFKVNGPAKINAPTLTTIVGWWLQNPYKTGQEVSRLIPYVTVLFTFVGEL